MIRFFVLFLLAFGALLFAGVKEEIDTRWSSFQEGRTFTPFQNGRSDADLIAEFENIWNTRMALYETEPFKPAQNLLDGDLVRAPGCVAFAFNNTASNYNASTVYVHEEMPAIACEGPRSKDIPHFFSLIKDQKITHLVRLTAAFEGDTKKCHPYWQERLMQKEDGVYLVIDAETHVHAYDMEHWRDNQGVNPEELLAMALFVRKSLQDAEGKLLVHCSAGVGRTGTFLAALAILDTLDKGAPLSIEEIVYKLSLQRIFSVGKASQYVTLHRLAELYTH